MNELADYDVILADHAPILGILLSEFRLFDPEPDTDKVVISTHLEAYPRRYF